MTEHDGRPTGTVGLVSFGRLAVEAIPEIVSFQVLSSILLMVLAWGLRKLITIVAESTGSALTTANLGEVLLSWRGPVILMLLAMLVAVFVVLEVFTGIHLCDDILQGRPAHIRTEIVKGFRSLRPFLCPFGLLVLLHILLAVPLGGIGFSISLTKDFYIPHFIMEVVRSTSLYYVAYILVTAALAILGIIGIFTIHGVIIDGKEPLASFKDSQGLLRAHWRDFLAAMVLTLVTLVIVNVFASFLLSLPLGKLEAEASMFSPDAVVDSVAVLNGDCTQADVDLVLYRAACAFFVLGGGFLNYILLILSSAYLMLRFTRCYLEYTQDSLTKWPSRARRRGYWAKMLLVILVLPLLAALSLFIGLGFDSVMEREVPVRIVAHRTGGVMATENSLEGLELAVGEGCYAAETDVQRTKDGFYIINHDDTFKRLTGVRKKPGDLTLDEIGRFVVVDPISGRISRIATLEEMLDAAKGRIKLFLELKGVSADRRMVDDVVRTIRERDCVEDVALISLKYDVIDYAESTYPEFETGVLLFGALGDVSRVNCDLLILEEEMATGSLMDAIHARGKEVYVWTVNTKEGMHQFLDSACDGIITDQVRMAERVQEELDERSDLQLLRDRTEDLWD